MDLALTGRVLDADEALRTGLISRVVDEPRRVAEAVAGHDADAVRTVKARLADGADRERQERCEAEAFARLVADFDPSDRNG
jgi:enoyl-CoA hydratase/carnithine racemase